MAFSQLSLVVYLRVLQIADGAGYHKICHCTWYEDVHISTNFSEQNPPGMIHSSIKLLDFRVPIVRYISLRNAQRPTGVCSLVPFRHLALGLISLRLWLHSELPTFILHSLMRNTSKSVIKTAALIIHLKLMYLFCLWPGTTLLRWMPFVIHWRRNEVFCDDHVFITIWWFRKWWNCSYYKTKALKWDPQTRLPRV